MDDWNFWYNQECVDEYDVVQEEQDEDEAAEANQVQPLMQAPQQPQSTPITPQLCRDMFLQNSCLLRRYLLLS